MRCVENSATLRATPCGCGVEAVSSQSGSSKVIRAALRARL